MKREVDPAYLLDELDLPYNKDIILVNEIIDTSRWSINYRLVFKDEGKVWQTYYSEGATEYQDESPWEYDSVVILEEVHEVEKTIKVWEPVKC